MELGSISDFNARLHEVSHFRLRRGHVAKPEVTEKVELLVKEVISEMQRLGDRPLIKNQARRLMMELQRLGNLSPTFKVTAVIFEQKYQRQYHVFAPTFVATDYKKRNVSELKELFGADRLKVLASRYKDVGRAVNLSKEKVSDRDFQTLLIAAADVRSEDMEALWKQLKADPPAERVGCLSPADTRVLVDRFNSHTSVEGLSKEDMTLLMDVLAPFDSLEDIFLGKPPKIPDVSPDSGKTFRGIRERVCIQQQLRFMSANLESQSMKSDSLRDRTQEMERLKFATIAGKRLTAREPPVGAIVAHPDGFYKLHATIHGGGAYKLLLKTHSKEDKHFINSVCCRGTRVQRSATGAKSTIMDDLRNNLGAKGSLVTEKLTHSYLSDPKYGFVNSSDGKVNYLGFSLGGSTAQRDVCLNLKYIASLTTLCSAGVDYDTMDWFKEAIDRASLEKPIEITHVIDLPDRVHYSGDGRIGRGCDPSKVHVKVIGIEPANKTSYVFRPWTGYKGSRSLVKAIVDFLRALKGPHVRSAFDTNYRMYLLDSENTYQRRDLGIALDNHQLDPKGYAVFEKRRKGLAKTLESIGVLDEHAHWSFRKHLDMSYKNRIDAISSSITATKSAQAQVLS